MTVPDLTQTATQFAASVLEIAKVYRIDTRWYEAVAMLDTALAVDELSPHDRARLQTALAAYLMKHADYDRVESLLNDAQVNIDSVDDPSLESQILYELGELAYFRAMLQGGESYAAAHQFQQQSLAIREQNNDDIGKITSWSRIGILYEREGDDETARSYYDRLIALSDKVGYPRGKIRPLTHIGAFHHRSGEIETALEYYKQARAIGLDVGHADDRMFAWMNVGYAMFRLNEDMETVLDFLQHGRELAEKIGHKMATCVAHMRLGIAYTAAENLEKATFHYQRMADVALANGFDSFHEHAKTELNSLQKS